MKPGSKKLIFIIFRSFLPVLMLFTGIIPVYSQSTRKDRRLIDAGNTLYRQQKFAEAKVKYREALNLNPSGDVAKFNLGLCDIRMAESVKDNDSISSKLHTEAVQYLSEVAGKGKENPGLASKANYNMGNLQFQGENYREAINLYKQALRLDPSLNDARRNLRIAQLKLQQQENEDKNKDKQDKDQEQDKEDQQDRQDNQQDQDQQDQNQQDKKDQQEQPKDNEISQQAAQQILNAVENNEQRARQSNNKGEKAQGNGSHLKKW
ncbi:MAG: tetratricopeptide repeat protein [Muribaculaceae bacterium]|nr:tetratricopeptide repeat protein [Muribaculaceae bacterium]